MLITYCQKCHLMLSSEKLDDADLCEDCAAGRTRRLTRSRHSDQISRKRLMALSRNPRLKPDKTKPEQTGSADALPKVIANPEKDDIC